MANPLVHPDDSSQLAVIEHGKVVSFVDAAGMATVAPTVFGDSTIPVTITASWEGTFKSVSTSDSGWTGGMAVEGQVTGEFNLLIDDTGTAWPLSRRVL